MSYKYTIIVGSEWNKNGEYMPHNYTHPKFETLRDELIQMFGGYSETVVEGGWKNSSGVNVQEESRVFTVIDTTDIVKMGQLRRAGEQAKELLEQDSVLITIERLEAAQFI